MPIAVSLNGLSNWRCSGRVCVDLRQGARRDTPSVRRLTANPRSHPTYCITKGVLEATPIQRAGLVIYALMFLLPSQASLSL
jgi:hypothetical protein